MKLVIEVHDFENKPPEIQEVWELINGVAKRTFGISEDDLSTKVNLKDENGAKLTPKDGEEFLHSLYEKMNRSTFVTARFEN